MTQATVGDLIVVAATLSVAIPMIVAIVRYAMARDREWKRQRDAGWRYVGCTFFTGPIYAPPSNTPTRAQGGG